MFLQTDRADLGSEDTLGGRMSYARELAEMEMSEAARRLGVMTSTWKAWECDRDTPRSNRLFMMAGILGVTPIWLLAGRGPGPAENSLSQHSDSLTAQLKSALAEAAASQQRIQQIGEQLRIRAQKEDPETLFPGEGRHRGRKAKRRNTLYESSLIDSTEPRGLTMALALVLVAMSAAPALHAQGSGGRILRPRCRDLCGDKAGELIA